MGTVPSQLRGLMTAYARSRCLIGMEASIRCLRSRLDRNKSVRVVSCFFGRCLLLVGSDLVEAGLIRYPLQVLRVAVSDWPC